MGHMLNNQVEYNLEINDTNKCLLLLYIHDTYLWGNYKKQLALIKFKGTRFRCLDVLYTFACVCFCLSAV